MIPFDFEYYKPVTVQEAVGLFQYLSVQGKEPLYFSGGTEIITLGRINQLYTRAVIDIKGIPACTALGLKNQKLVLGSALTLSQLEDANVFPLLGEAAAGVADRTSRNKITLGGNLFSQFIYREAVLPLLLTDSAVVIHGLGGERQVPIHSVFKQTMQLGKGELLVQTVTDTSFIPVPYVVAKKRKVAEIDYPLVTVAALRADAATIRVAFSGICSFPFRSQMVEEILNNRHLSLEARIDQAAARLPAPILDDIRGSAAYRAYVLKNTLQDVVRSLGGE